MTTSDQDGQHQLTRKQLREIRLTGSTPVITGEEAAAASQPAPVLPRAAEPVEIAPAPEIEVQESDAPLTRRQMRALEHLRVAAGEQAAPAPAVADEPVEAPEAESPAVEAPAVEAPTAEQSPFESVLAVEQAAMTEGLVSEVPVFEPRPASASISRFDAPEEPQSPAPSESDPQPVPEAEERTAPDSGTTDEPDELEVITAERPMVGAAFGLGIQADKPAGTRFDDLLDGGSSSGSQHSTSTALIFTPSAGAGSLSGPIASTGELLITGTYALPDGIGSHGHAHGTTDGRDVDAVLLDGELAPSSSPTPIAASAAISTSKSAGEVIRPPAPDKGNKLMLTLAIVAGGLALALAATLIIASTTGVFG